MAGRTELRELTRVRVLEAASELFAREGYRDTTIREIATRADVSVGTVMAVGDKRSLLVDIFDRAIAAVHQRPRPVPAAAAAKDSCANRATRVIEPFLDLFAERIDLAREYGAILMSGDHRSEVFSGLADSLRAELAVEARASGLETSAVDAAVSTAYFAYLGVLFSWSARGSFDAAGPRGDFAAVVDHLFSRRNAGE